MAASLLCAERAQLVAVASKFAKNSRQLAAPISQPRHFIATAASTRPGKQGLYSPENEKDSCGIGLLASLSSKPSRSIVSDSLEVLARLSHAASEESNSGDGAGVLLGMPDQWLRARFPRLPPLGRYAAGLVFLPPNDVARTKALIELLLNELDKAAK